MMPNKTKLQMILRLECIIIFKKELSVDVCEEWIVEVEQQCQQCLAVWLLGGWENLSEKLFSDNFATKTSVTGSSSSSSQAGNFSSQQSTATQIVKF